MNVFLDTSVLIAACASETGASREVCRRARGGRGNGWSLTIVPYVVEEVDENIGRFSPTARAEWEQLLPTLRQMPNVLTFDRPVVFGPTKDRPILFSAFAWADVLLTLDLGDFGPLLDDGFYGMPVLTPGLFLEHERAAGRFRE